MSNHDCVRFEEGRESAEAQRIAQSITAHLLS
jgi:hypothetical protein